MLSVFCDGDGLVVHSVVQSLVQASLEGMLRHAVPTQLVSKHALGDTALNHGHAQQTSEWNLQAHERHP